MICNEYLPSSDTCLEPLRRLNTALAEQRTVETILNGGVEDDGHDFPKKMGSDATANDVINNEDLADVLGDGSNF